MLRRLLVVVVLAPLLAIGSAPANPKADKGDEARGPVKRKTASRPVTDRDAGGERFGRPGSHRDGPRSGPMGRRGRGGGRGQKLTQQQEDELLAFVAKHRPRRHQRLVGLRQSDPRAYRWAMGRMWGWYQRWKTLSEGERKAALKQEQAGLRIWPLVRAYHRTDAAADEQRLTTEIRQAVTQRFEAEQTFQEQRLAQLE